MGKMYKEVCTRLFVVKICPCDDQQQKQNKNKTNSSPIKFKSIISCLLGPNAAVLFESDP